MFALDLSNLKEVDKKAQSTLGRVRPGNDIIIYFDQNNPLHAGKVRSGKVVSKWNIDGYLWEHGVDEVPLCFGSNKKYFRNISKALALQFSLSILAKNQ